MIFLHGHNAIQISLSILVSHCCGSDVSRGKALLALAAVTAAHTFAILGATGFAVKWATDNLTGMAYAVVSIGLIIVGVLAWAWTRKLVRSRFRYRADKVDQDNA